MDNQGIKISTITVTISACETRCGTRDEIAELKDPDTDLADKTYRCSKLFTSAPPYSPYSSAIPIHFTSRAG